MRIPEAHADELVLRPAEAVLVDAGGHDLVRAAAVLVQAEVGLEILGRRRARVVRRRQVRVGRRLSRVLPELEEARRARHLEAAEVLRLEIAGEVCKEIGLRGSGQSGDPDFTSHMALATGRLPPA